MIDRRRLLASPAGALALAALRPLAIASGSLAGIARAEAAASAQPGLPVAAAPQALSRTPLVFPRDLGAHQGSRIEWWYVTGALNVAGRAQPFGFQITFFASRTDLTGNHPSRFAAREIIFAHAAVTDVAAGKLHHDQRIGRPGFGLARTSSVDTDVSLRDWHLQRSGTVDASRYAARVRSESGQFGYELQLAATQPLLLQGDGGWSRKGPLPGQASRYYSEPHLAVTGSLTVEGRTESVTGTAWLDHEWSEGLLDAQAVGWDWVGMNLDDGGALTAFQMRKADGSALWAGGSHRSPGGVLRNFGPQDVRFSAGRRWTSPSTRTAYPVHWTLATPAGRFTVEPLLDNQELDSRGSTGTVYWEGLSVLKDASGRRVGGGYLEMTGYVSALKL